MLKYKSRIILGAGGIILLIGLALLVVFPSWGLLPYAFGYKNPPIDCQTWATAIFGVLFTGLGIGLLISGGKSLSDAPEKEPDRSNVLYGRYLVGVGYVLIVDGILNLVAFAGFARNCTLDKIFPPNAHDLFTGTSSAATNDAGHPLLAYFIYLVCRLFGNNQEECLVTTIVLLVSLGMAVLGVLFFFANSLWDQMQAREEFNEDTFWGGFLFRIGEAIIFTVVVFLVLRYKQASSSTVFALPIIALLLGMFVKSGENLISGIADRFFKAVDAMIPPITPPATDSTAKTFAFRLHPAPSPQPSEEVGGPVAPASNGGASATAPASPVSTGGSAISKTQQDSILKTIKSLKNILDVRWFDGPPAELRVMVGPGGAQPTQIVQAVFMEGITAEQLPS